MGGRNPAHATAVGKLLLAVGRAVFGGVLDDHRLIVDERIDCDGTVGAVTVGADGSLPLAAEKELLVIRREGSRVAGPPLARPGERRRLNDGRTGDEFRRLVITTTTDEQQRRFPDSGVFTVRVDVPGQPVPTWSGTEHLPLEPHPRT